MNKTVVVAMSGGVDSSVAALLLKEQGYNCIGITMKLWDYEMAGGNVNQESGCCSLDSINDARMVCAQLGIPHYVLNFSHEFHDHVVDDFIREYLAGRTPNPCVQCNIRIKWESLIDKARELGAGFIATGHYAQILQNTESQRYELHRGSDPHKDQSYALWGIRQENLARTLFPIGALSKPEVREMARRKGLRTADKKESQEICFIPDNDYHRFLKSTVPDLEDQVKDGHLVNPAGTKIGSHRGYPFFTIGQRRGIGTGFGKPMYVIDTHADSNEVVIGEKEDLLASELIAANVNFVSIADAGDGVKAIIKIRYNDSGSPGVVYSEGKYRIRVRFDEPKEAITPGQSVVFYDGDRLLGGAIIEAVRRN